jgi:NTE family protein
MDHTEVLRSKNNRVALALGGGGAKGLAHIPFLEAIDQQNLEVKQVAGTSIGAIVGALYAGGMKAADIRRLFTELFEKNKTGKVKPGKMMRLYPLVKPSISRSSLFKMDGLFDLLESHLPCKNIEDLPIPLKVVASDFWKREQVVFDQGDIIRALRASSSIAGIFKPVISGDSVYVDGGGVNPVPFDLLDPKYFIIAIDVLGSKVARSNNIAPGFFESIFNTYQIMEESKVRRKLHSHPPDLYIKPEIQNIRVFDFKKYPEIFAYGETHREAITNLTHYVK